MKKLPILAQSHRWKILVKDLGTLGGSQQFKIKEEYQNISQKLSPGDDFESEWHCK